MKNWRSFIFAAIVGLAAGYFGWTLHQKHTSSSPLLINASLETITDVKLGEQSLVNELGIWPGGSKEINIDTVGAGIPFSFKVKGKTITESISLRSASTEDSSIVAIIIEKDLSVRVIKGMA